MACIYLYSANIHGPTVRLQILFTSTGFKTVAGIVFLMFDYYKSWQKLFIKFVKQPSVHIFESINKDSYNYQLKRFAFTIPTSGVFYFQISNGIV